MAGYSLRLLLVMSIILNAACLSAEQGVSSELKGKIDAAVKQVMEKTGVPSASVGIVQGGKVVYTAAYGQASLSPALAASPEMHYAIGSISKQFTTACILLLAEEGKLTLDDPVSRWFPELTRANEVKVRNLLTHTSGYEDTRHRTTPSLPGPRRPSLSTSFTSGQASRWTSIREQSGSTAIRTS